MATTIFESIVDNNLGEKTSSKGASYTQKTDSSEFRDLIDNKTSQFKIDDSRSGAKTKDERSRVVESIGKKQASNTKEQVAKETSAETVISIDQTNLDQEVVATILPIEGVILPIEETMLATEIEEDIIPEEDLDQREEDIVPVIDLPQEQDNEIELSDLVVSDFVDNKVDEENVVALGALPEIAKVIDSENVSKTGVAVSTNGVVSEPIDITELPLEDQAMHQNLKTFDLPTGFTADDVSDVELLTDKPQVTPQSNGARQLEELSSKLEAPVNLVVDGGESGKNTVENTKPIIVAPSLNLALADNTRHGKNIISRMQTPASDQNAAVISEGEELVLDNEAIIPNLGDKDNSSAGQRSASSLEAFGAVIEQANDETFEITFKGQDFSAKRSEMPKPAMQVSLAVSEVLNSSSAGKKQITINLHPQTLGAVKVEILSQVGHDGASKVESIKISADKHDTLVMLEEHRAELAKSLKEVNGTEEKEANLQFEMSQDQGKGQGAYFTSLEERNNWMSRFVGLVADDELQTGNDSHEVDEYATRGIITEDKVDLVA